MNNNAPIIFIPKFFLLWDLMICVIFLIGVDLWLCLYLKNKINFGEFFILSIIFKVVIIYGIWMIICYPTMNYALYKDRLVLKCGLFKSVIHYSDIKNISLVPSLRFSVVSSLVGYRTPNKFIRGITPSNFINGPFHFSKYGWIRMYATSHKNVIVIETEKKRYGITPQEPERFLAELKAKIESENRN